MSFNELVLAEVSCYKSEPELELRESSIKWWKSHHQSYPNQARWRENTWEYLQPLSHQNTYSALLQIWSQQSEAALNPENVEKLFLHDNLPNPSLSYKRAKTD